MKRWIWNSVVLVWGLCLLYELDSIPAMAGTAPDKAIPLLIAQPDSNKLQSVTPEPAQPEPSMPEDIPLKPDQAVLGYLLQKGFFNPFPDKRFYPDAPISRAEFAALLHRASGFITPFVSEFPYFRDVLTDHWAYSPIEGLRMRDVLGGTAQGWFYPDRPITRLEAGVMLSKSLDAVWLKLNPQEIEEIFAAYQQPLSRVDDLARYDVARSIYAGFILPESRYDPVRGVSYLTLNLDLPLARMDAARLVYRRALIEEEEQAPIASRRVMLPPGVGMTITPTTAISQETIAVGQTIYFALINTVNLPEMNLFLPKGTRVIGKVTEISTDRLQATVSLDRVSLPPGESYDLSAHVLLNFQPGKRDHSFLAPGENLQIRTLPPP